MPGLINVADACLPINTRNPEHYKQHCFTPRLRDGDVVERGLVRRPQLHLIRDPEIASLLERALEGKSAARA